MKTVGARPLTSTDNSYVGFKNLPKVLQPGGWRVPAALLRSGVRPRLGVKKSHSPIPLKAHGKGPAVCRLGCEPLCMGG
jgi:hypothetical protein